MSVSAAAQLFRAFKVDKYVGLTAQLARQVGVTLAEDAGSR